MLYCDTYIDDLRAAQEQVPGLRGLFGKTVMVTGATGLIGSAIVDFLMQLNLDECAGIRILAAGRSVPKFQKRFADRICGNDLFFYPFDALDPPLSGEWPDPLPDFYIHAAGSANPALYASHPTQTMIANILGTEAMLKMAAASPAGRILYVSSGEVYGRLNTAAPFSEEIFGEVDILNPRSCYPVSKRAAETLCAGFRAEQGLDVIIVRPGHIYGPTMTNSDNRASSQFPRDAAAGSDIILKSSGSQVRSYCYVVDCVTAMLTVLLKGEPGKAYNIATNGCAASIREMAEAVAEAAGRKVLFENPTQIEKAAFNMMDHAVLDTARLEALGWKGRFDLQTGIRHTMACLQDRKK